MSGGGSAPKAPDPTKTAQAQASANLDAAIASQQMSLVDQKTPWGSVTYNQVNSGQTSSFDQDAYDAAMKAYQSGGQAGGSRQPYKDPQTGQWVYAGDPGYNAGATRGAAPNRDDFMKTVQGAPRYEAVTTLSPEQQRLLETYERGQQQFGDIALDQMGQVGGRLSQPFDLSGLGPAPEINEQTRQNVAGAIRERSQPQMDRRLDQLRTSLATQGITDPGSEAYKRGIDEYYRSVNDFDLAAEVEALDQAVQLFQAEGQARNQGINERVMERQIPLNELLAMLGQTQTQMPQFNNTPGSQTQPADIMGATYGSYNAEQNAYNQAQANSRSNLQGLASLGGAAAMMFSDRRLKRDAVRIGTLPSGLGVWLFRYLWSPALRVGLMADEVRRLRPDAVVRLGGFDAVDYGKALA